MSYRAKLGLSHHIFVVVGVQKWNASEMVLLFGSVFFLLLLRSQEGDLNGALHSCRAGRFGPAGGEVCATGRQPANLSYSGWLAAVVAERA